MKKTLSLLVFLLSSIVILAQSVEYQTFIYTSDDWLMKFRIFVKKGTPPQLYGRLIQCQ